MLTQAKQSTGDFDIWQRPLGDVKEFFEQWRKKATKTDKIPDELWDQVIELSPHYHQSTILSALKITAIQLECYIKYRSSSPKSNLLPHPGSDTKRESAHFVQAIMETPPAADEHINYHDVELTRSNGTTLKIEAISNQDIFKLVNEFIKESP